MMNVTNIKPTTESLLLKCVLCVLLLYICTVIIHNHSYAFFAILE